MTLTKSEKSGFVGTILIHLLLMVYLMFFGFDKAEPVLEDGLAVNFGNIDEAAGVFEPEGDIQAENKEAVSIPEPKSESKLISQDKEPSISLEKKKATEPITQKAKKKESDQNQKTQAIRQQMANAFGTPGGKGKSQGNSASGIGNQGKISGDPNASNTSGNGGIGYGQFSLNGRSLNGGLPHPSYSIQEEGIVVVQISVNPKGNVTTASVALKGTNTDNSTLRSAALAAARLATFNAIDGNQNQSGTITYRFRLK